MSAENSSPTPLSDKQLERYEKLLLDRQAELEEDVEQLEGEALKPEEEVSVDHMADHGSEAYEQEQSLGFMERDREALRAIEDALLKIEEKTYGICEECEGKIKSDRLSALPWARLCIECQTAEEQGGT